MKKRYKWQLVGYGLVGCFSLLLLFLQVGAVVQETHNHLLGVLYLGALLLILFGACYAALALYVRVKS